MKTKFLLLMLIAHLFSCNTGQIKELKKENERLQNEAARKDSAVKNFLYSFNKIVENLNFINEAEKAIALKIKENKKLSETDKKLIIEKVEMINSCIKQNKNISDTLRSSLEISQFNLDEFSKMTENLHHQVEEKNVQLNSLKQMLSDVDMSFKTFDFWLDELTTANIAMEKTTKEQKKIIEKQQQQLNAAYYISGTYKELNKAGILTKSGIGRKEKLIANFNNSNFTKIDIRETMKIEINGNNLRIITNHLPGSYYVEKTKAGQSLVITNPDEFWKVTKYLVIKTE